MMLPRLWEPRGREGGGPAAAKVRSARLLEHLTNKDDAPVIQHDKYSQPTPIFLFPYAGRLRIAARRR
jgi:hypothetical protein